MTKDKEGDEVMGESSGKKDGDKCEGQTEKEVKNVEGNDEQTKEFKGLIEDIDSFTQKADDLMDKFIRSDEHWFYRQLLKMV